MEDSTPISELPNRAAGAGAAAAEMPASAVMMPPATSGQIDPRYMNRVIMGLQEANNSTLGTLPSRDIPINTLSIQQDEHIRANYIPSGGGGAAARDYVSDYERSRAARTMATPQLPRAPAVELNSTFDEYYIPFLLICLFFIFQMPTVNSIFFKYARFLHTADGNITGAGILVKSVAFGVLYYIIMHAAKKLA